MKYCICKIQRQNNIFQPSESLNFEIFPAGPTMVYPIVDTGYERMPKTLESFR